MSVFCQLYPSSLEEQDDVVLQSWLGFDPHFRRRKGFFGCYLEVVALMSLFSLQGEPQEKALRRRGLKVSLESSVAAATEELWKLPCTFRDVAWDKHPENSYSREHWQSSPCTSQRCPPGQRDGHRESCGWSCVWPQSRHRPKLCWAGQGELCQACKQQCSHTLLLAADTLSPHTGSNTTGLNKAS